jgi:putative phosphoesterase
MLTGSAKGGEALVGVISDTHGLLRSEAVEAFAGVDLIIHAGDIGKPEVLEALRLVAPVHAVRGNMDVGAWVSDLPETEVIQIAGLSFYVLHDLAKLDLDPGAAGFSVVISGHTHRPAAAMRKGILFLNPGTAGPFRSTVSVALLKVRRDSVEPKLVMLQV